MDRTHDGRQTRRRGEKLLRAKDLLALPLAVTVTAAVSR